MAKVNRNYFFIFNIISIYLIISIIEIISIYFCHQFFENSRSMRIWNEIELFKSCENSRAFLANNLYCLKQGLTGVSHVEIYATGSQKSNSGDCSRTDANLFRIISRNNP